MLPACVFLNKFELDQAVLQWLLRPEAEDPKLKIRLLQFQDQGKKLTKDFGLLDLPPVYPETTSINPGIFSKSASMHQKHPPAKTAVFKFPPAEELPDEINNTKKNKQGKCKDFVLIFIFE